MENLPVVEIDNKKCYICGKSFRTPAELLKHKNRKIPCLIREVKPENADNPNRCIHCNKILSRKENLVRHLKNCKIKNGGVEIPLDGVIYEPDLKIPDLKTPDLKTPELKTPEEKNVYEIQLLKEQNIKMERRLEELEEKINKIIRHPIVTNNTTNNTTNNNNNTVNNTINIMMDSNNPASIEHIVLSLSDAIIDQRLSRILFEKIHMNPEIRAVIKNEEEPDDHDDKCRLIEDTTQPAPQTADKSEKIN